MTNSRRDVPSGTRGRRDWFAANMTSPLAPIDSPLHSTSPGAAWPARRFICHCPRLNARCVLRSTRRAFSLIELLSVLAILGLLTAVLMPSLSGARRTASSTACQANLRQWAAATGMYAQQNDGFLPRRGQGAQPTTMIVRSEDWFNALPPLLGQPTYLDLFNQGGVVRPGTRSVWMCPTAVDYDGIHYFAYGMNMRLSIWMTAQPDKIDRVAPTSVQVLFADGPGRFCSIFPSPQPFSPDPRHDRRLNIAFLDGHVASFQGDYAGCGVGDLKRPDLRWDVPNSPWEGPIP